MPFVLVLLVLLRTDPPAFVAQAEEDGIVYGIEVAQRPNASCGIMVTQIRTEGDVSVGDYRRRRVTAADCDCDLRPDGGSVLFDPAGYSAFGDGFAVCRGLLTDQD